MSDPAVSAPKRTKISPPDLIETFILGSQLPPDSPERWFTYEGSKYTGHAVSTQGRVFNGKTYIESRTGKFNAHHTDSKRPPSRVTIRSAVCLTFFGALPKHHTVGFRDGNPKNLNLSNLSYQSKYEILATPALQFAVGDPLPPDSPETWWVCPGPWPNVSVSTLGRVRHQDCVLTSWAMSGYRGVKLRDASRVKQNAYVHYLVAITFLGPRPSPSYDVSHQDDNRQNNRLSNLLWETHTDNTIRFTTKRRRAIIARSDDGQLKNFGYSDEAAEFFQKDPRVIRKYCERRWGCDFDGQRWTFEYSTESQVQPRLPAPDNRTDWVAVPGFSRYECLPEGLIRNVGDCHLLRPSKGSNYLVVGLRDADGRPRSKQVHEVICTAFHGPRPSPKHLIHHKNENKLDNRASNLEWTLHNTALSCGKPCERRLPDGNWTRYISVAEAARENQISEHTIRRSIKNNSTTIQGILWRWSEIPNIIQE